MRDRLTAAEDTRNAANAASAGWTRRDAAGSAIITSTIRQETAGANVVDEQGCEFAERRGRRMNLVEIGLAPGAMEIDEHRRADPDVGLRPHPSSVRRDGDEKHWNSARGRLLH